MTKNTTVTVDAAQYSDEDDCLAAAAEAYIAEHPELEGWDLEPRWVGGDHGQRDEIALTVPAANDAEVA